MEVNAFAAQSTAVQSQPDRKAIADNFDAFLSLLTTQLRNQNPLDPLDTNEFTAQLVQFSGVEQSIKTNENLSQLIAQTSANVLNNAVGFIGKVVTATGDTTILNNGLAQWSYTTPQDVPKASITIKDQHGVTVFTQETLLAKGTNTLQWDGRKNDGSIAPNGSYTISVDAKDADGNAVKVDTTVIGLVQSVDLAGSEPVLTISGSKVKFSDVKTVSQAP